MADTFTEERPGLDDEQIGAAEERDHIQVESHDGSSAPQESRTDSIGAQGTSVGGAEDGDSGEREHGDESGESTLPFIEEAHWKTEIVDDYPEGFPRLAALINTDPTFPIYRRFSRGRTRIILQLQAELMTLEKKLDQYDREIAENTHTEWSLHQSGFLRRENAEPASDLLWTMQARYYRRFNDALKLYDEAIIRDFKIRRLPSPSRHARKNIGRYFFRSCPLVEGENDYLAYVEDLIAIGKGEKDSWLEGSIAGSLKSKPLRFLKKYFVSPEQRQKVRGDRYGESEAVHFLCSKRLKTTADIVMILLIFMLSLLPFYMFFNVDLTIIIVAFVSSLLSALFLSIYIAPDRPQLCIIVMSQSSFLVLSALVAQVLNNFSISILDNWFKFHVHPLVSGALNYNGVMCSVFFCLLVLLYSLNNF